MAYDSRHSVAPAAAAPASFARRVVLRGSLLATLLAPVCFFAALAAPAQADVLSGKGDLFLSRKLSRKPAAGWSRVIVRLGHGFLSAPQRTRIRSLGGFVYRHLPLIESVAVQLPTKNLARLAALPFVARLSTDMVVAKNDEFTVGSSLTDGAAGQSWLTGFGVSVAVVDSGIRTSADLNESQSQRSRIAANVDFVGGASSSADDLCGHGTHVAGIIAGNGAASTGPNYYRTFYGIAPRAGLVNVRVLDAEGQGVVSNVVRAIDWIISNKDRYNIRVLNLSAGHPVGESYTTDPLCRAVEQAWKAGIVVVCAAGNGGRAQNLLGIGIPLLDNEGYGTAYGTIQSPGNSPYVITVGAMKSVGGGRANDRIATYSSRGPTRLDRVLKPDLVAPGNRVISLNAPRAFLADLHGATNLVTWQEFCREYDPADTAKYFRLSGTSMAAPVVSGAAALMLQADPTLSPDTVKARLMLSADKWGFPGGRFDPCTFGAGYLNIPAALNCTVIATHYAQSPSLSRDGSGSVLINLHNLVWSGLGIWGTGINDTHIMWGSGAVSGSSVMTNSGVLWGVSVWIDNTVRSVLDIGVDLSGTVIRGDGE